MGRERRDVRTQERSGKPGREENGDETAGTVQQTPIEDRHPTAIKVLNINYQDLQLLVHNHPRSYNNIASFQIVPGLKEGLNS